MHIIFDVLWLDYMLHKHTSHNGSFRYALKLHGSEFLRTNVIWAEEHIERVLKWSFELKSKRNEPYSLANNWEKSRIECYSFHSFRGIGKLVFCFLLILSHFFLLRLLITEMKTTNKWIVLFAITLAIASLFCVRQKRVLLKPKATKRGEEGGSRAHWNISFDWFYEVLLLYSLVLCVYAPYKFGGFTLWIVCVFVKEKWI